LQGLHVLPHLQEEQEGQTKEGREGGESIIHTSRIIPLSFLFSDSTCSPPPWLLLGVVPSLSEFPKEDMVSLNWKSDLEASSMDSRVGGWSETRMRRRLGNRKEGRNSQETENVVCQRPHGISERRELRGRREWTRAPCHLRTLAKEVRFHSRRE
jgi:hypothetical protein